MKTLTQLAHEYKSDKGLNIQENKTFFQVCINLNDEHPEIHACREKLLKLNPGWDYICITSRDQFNQLMQHHFGDVNDPFLNTIHAAFNEIPNIVGPGKKAREAEESQKEHLHNICKLVSQTDLFRLAVIYKFGGVYFDMSSRLQLNMNEVVDKYDCCFVRTPAEIRTSFLYAAKNNGAVRRLLDFVIHNILVKRVSHQMLLAGPAAWTNAFDKTISSGDIEYNRVKVFKENTSETTWWKMDAPWKHSLHTPSKINPSKKINQHWLFNY